MELLQQVYFGNSVLQWGIGLAVAIFALIVFWATKTLIVRWLRKLAGSTATDIDDFVVHLLGSTKTILILVLALYAGSYVLFINDTARDLLDTGAILVSLLQAALWGNQTISYLVKKFTTDRMEAEDPTAATLGSLLGTVARIAFFTMVVLVALGTVGFDVTPLITGVGIGGIAIAMAIQGILSDLFASLSIALDKPFEVGDFITVGEFKGTVEKIGLKSTRMRSSTGEQLVLSNSDLLGSRMRNFKRMSERRGATTVGVTYQTTGDQLATIPEIIREIVEAEPNTRFDRAHFASFGDSALNFDFVYWITTPAYSDFMDATQSINMQIVERFDAAGIEFAYPTQTLFVEKDGTLAGSAAKPGGSSEVGGGQRR